MMTTNSLGIYIHVPFCRSKCPYCDFYSVVSGQNDRFLERKSQYTAALLAEIKDFCRNNSEKAEKCIVNTVYFGGGTPNLLKNDEFSRIITLIKNEFNLENPEITVEFNPFLMDKNDENAIEELRTLRETGVNRLSIGAQSFDNGILKKLGRLHKSEDTIRTLNLARKAGFENVSVDLMFGIEGQSFETWMESVRTAIKLSPEHISMYSLEFMEGTRFTKLLEEGKMKETPEEEDRRMYEEAVKLLSGSGYDHYEISNLAKPGFESKHNLKYWSLEEYAGFGPSAHSYIDHRRYSNAADINLYLSADDIDRIRTVYEENSAFDDMSEYTFTGLRKSSGIDLMEFYQRFGTDFWTAFEFSKPLFMNFVKDGFAEIYKEKDQFGFEHEKIRLTLKGFNISNQILCLFV